MRSTLSFWSRGHKAVGGNPVSWNRYGIVWKLRGSTSYQTAGHREEKTKSRNAFRAALIGRPTTTNVYAEMPSSLWNVQVNRQKNNRHHVKQTRENHVDIRLVRLGVSHIKIPRYHTALTRGSRKRLQQKKCQFSSSLPLLYTVNSSRYRGKCRTWTNCSSTDSEVKKKYLSYQTR